MLSSLINGDRVHTCHGLELGVPAKHPILLIELHDGSVASIRAAHIVRISVVLLWKLEHVLRGLLPQEVLPHLEVRHAKVVLYLWEFIGSVGYCLENLHQLLLFIHQETGINVGFVVALVYRVKHDRAIRLVFGWLSAPFRSLLALK